MKEGLKTIAILVLAIVVAIMIVFNGTDHKDALKALKMENKQLEAKNEFVVSQNKSLLDSLVVSKQIEAVLGSTIIDNNEKLKDEISKIQKRKNSFSNLTKVEGDSLINAYIAANQ